ncbi:hypothetical protein HK097_008714, partial [Rhizophlyctis rosea]
MYVLASLPVIGVLGLIIYSYEPHPLTQRPRLMFIDPETELSHSLTSHNSLLSLHSARILPPSHPSHIITLRVCQALLSIIGPVEGRQWEIYVVGDDSVENALVIPCGKIFVFTGLLKRVRTEAELAAVLSHELGHVLSRHGAEEMGFQHLSTLFTDLLHSTLYTLTLNLPFFSDIAGRSIDSTKEYITSMPYSRMCEREADVIGIYLMSMA